MEGIYANIRANIYLATMKQADLARVIECPIEGRAGHEDFHEGGREGRWIRFLQGQNPNWPDEALTTISIALNIRLPGSRSTSAIRPGGQGRRFMGSMASGSGILRGRWSRA